MPLVDQRLHAREALARYWRHLLGLILFPPVALTATNTISLQRDLQFFLFTLLFFASIAPVVWLLVTKRVRFSFWLVATGIYFAAGILTSVGYQIVRAITA
jgi:hypothetical protein